MEDRTLIVYQRQRFEVGIASTDDELKEAKLLDDLAFGPYHGVTLGELEKIRAVGKLILLREEGSGELIGESQIIFEPIEELPYEFSHPVGFCYGTAVSPNFQGRGLGRLLALQQEAVSIICGKKELQMTIRVENYPSLRMRTKLGYKIYGYQEDFYGSDVSADSRLFLKKRLDDDVKTASCSVVKSIRVAFGSEHDSEAHRCIKRMLELGYRGIAVDRENIYFV